MALILSLSQFCICTAAAASPFLQVRAYNPFTQIYGRPDFFDGTVSGVGTGRIRTALNIVSLTDIETRPGGSLELDGEIYQLDLTYDRVFGQGLEIGVRIPVIHHSGGWMDAPLTDWHQLLGVPNGKRGIQEQGKLRLYFDDGAGTTFLKEESGTGLGDVQFSARYRLTSESSERQLALHAGLKTPTGDAGDLNGSGAFDASLGIGLSDPVSLRGLRTTLSANAGLVLLGKGDILPEYQRSSVLFAGFQVAARLTARLSLIGGVQGSSSYFDTDVGAIGDDTIALILGGSYLTRSGWQLRFGIVEDGFSRVMPDFALHFDLAKCLGQDC